MVRLFVIASNARSLVLCSPLELRSKFFCNFKHEKLLSHPADETESARDMQMSIL